MFSSLLRITGALFLLWLLGQGVVAWLTPSAEQQAQKLVDQVRQQGPKSITPELRLMRAALAGRQLQFYFAMDPARALKLDGALMQKVFHNALCADAQTREINRQLGVTYFIEADAEVVHRFELPAGACT